MSRTPRIALLPLALLALPAAAAGCREAEPLPETPPQRVSESTFHYPEELWDEGVEGQTMLRVYVAPTGQVDSVDVEASSGYAAFDSAATRGAYQMQFEPARRGDEPIGVWVLLPVQFEMSNAVAEPQGQP